MTDFEPRFNTHKLRNYLNKLCCLHHITHEEISGHPQFLYEHQILYMEIPCHTLFPIKRIVIICTKSLNNHMAIIQLPLDYLYTWNNNHTVII